MQFKFACCYLPTVISVQESICADAASFDLPSWLLTACISEAQTCIDLAIERREKSNDKSQNPDDFAILRGVLQMLVKVLISLDNVMMHTFTYFGSLIEENLYTLKFVFVYLIFW